MSDEAQVRIEGMPPAVLEEFKSEVFQRMAALKQADGLHYRRRACSVVGMKPLVELG